MKQVSAGIPLVDSPIGEPGTRLKRSNNAKLAVESERSSAGHIPVRCPIGQTLNSRSASVI